MALTIRDNEREVLLDTTLEITDFERDKLVLHLVYNSTMKPEFAAKLVISLVDTSEDGTWVTAEELDAMSAMFKDAADALRLAKKPLPKGRRFK